jgi:hypothetical protein
MKTFCLTIISLFIINSLIAQCPNVANVAANGNCIFISWTTVPNPRPSSLVQSGVTFTFQDSVIGSPTVYRYKNDNNCSNSTPSAFTGTFTIGSTTCSYNAGVLPLKFLSWNAEYLSDQIKVTWTTVQEVNVDHFIVFSSTDAANWIEEAKVDYSLERNETGRYGCEFPGKSPFPSYIKIQVVDKNGTSSSSKIFGVNGKENAELSFYPNLVNSTYITSICKDCDKNGAKYTLINIEGKTALRVNNVYDGDKIDVSTLPKGAYLVQMISGSKSSLTKLFIVD